jgi:hypothetical protein
LGPMAQGDSYVQVSGLVVLTYIRNIISIGL